MQRSPDSEQYQHPDCLDNVKWVPPWYDLPRGADPSTHNPWLIADSATKQTPMDLFIARVGQEGLKKRIKEWVDAHG